MQSYELIRSGRRTLALEVRGGRVKLTGRVDIEGELYINGAPYSPCRC